MATQVQAGWAIGNIENVDTRLGPWDTTDEFTGSVDITRRYLGMTIIVTGSGDTEEYWFRDGITDSDLVFKQPFEENYITAYTYSFSASAPSSFNFASRPVGTDQTITLGNAFDNFLIKGTGIELKNGAANVPLTGSIISLSLHLSASTLVTDTLKVAGVEAITVNPGGTVAYVGGSGIITQLIGSEIYINAPLSMSANAPITASGGITGSIIGTLTGTASHATFADDALSSSYALTASYVEGGGGEGFPFVGDAVITGSLLISGGDANGSLTATSITASIISASGNINALNAVISKSISAEGSITTNDFIYLDNGKSIVWDDGASNEGTLRGVANRFIFLSGSTQMATISSSGIFSQGSLFATLSAGTDDSVVIYTSTGELKTDEIDSRVWGSTLVDGNGTANNLAYWTGSSTLGNSNFFFISTLSASLTVKGKVGQGEIILNGISGSISASGGISASGDLYINDVYASDYTGNSYSVDGIAFASFNVDEIILGNNTYNLSFKGAGYKFIAPITASIISASSGITGSLYGTSSWATDAISSSYALTASYAANASTPTLQQVTDEGASTTTSITASIISASGGITGSLYGTSSWAVSSSYATTAAYAANASTPTLQQVTDEGASTTTSITASIISASNGFIGDLTGTASYATDANLSNIAFSSSIFFLYNAAADEEFSIPLADSSGNNYNYQYLDSDNNITYNPSTNTLTVPNVTSSLYGTSSWATDAVDAVSSSYALTASYASNASTPTLQQVTDEGASTTTSITASVISASGGFTGNLTGTASYATTAVVATFGVSASKITIIDASSGERPLILGENDIDTYQTLGIDSANDITYNPSTNILTVPNVSASTVTASNGFLGDLVGTSSWATDAISSSYALTASFATNIDDSGLVRNGGSGAANRIAYWTDTENIGGSATFRFNGTYFDINSYNFVVTASTGDVDCGDIKAGDINASIISASATNYANNVIIGKTGVTMSSAALPAIASNNYIVWAGGKTGQIGYRVGTSRRETKYDINPVSQELVDGINQLQPVTYIYKADEEKRTVGGFIAEEVAEVNPLFAKWGPNYKINDSGSLDIDNILDDTLIPSDIDDRTILAAAVAKIQQLEKEIQELKAKIT